MENGDGSDAVPFFLRAERGRARGTKMNALPDIRVTRETYETPAGIRERLLAAGGTNLYGEANFRVVWGGSRLTWVGGRWTDRDARGNVIREAIETRQVPKYLPMDRWHIGRGTRAEAHGTS